VTPLRLLALALLHLLRYPKYWWRLVARPSQVRLRGVLIQLDEEVPDAVRHQIYSERYERGEARCIVARLEPDDVVLEIGGGIGFLSTLCAQRIGSERVFSYEANPELIGWSERTYELNGVFPTLTSAMLGQTSTQRVLYVESEFVSSSTLRRSSQGKKILVPQLEVNREIERVNRSMLVMDIEGGESELVPAINWRGIRKVVLELHPGVIGKDGAEKVMSHLLDAGFLEDRRLSTTRKKYLERAE